MCGPQHIFETLSLVLCCFSQLSFFQAGGLEYQCLALFSQAGGLEYQLCICFPGWRLGVSTFHFSHRLGGRSINFPFFLGWRLGVLTFHLFPWLEAWSIDFAFLPQAGGSEYRLSICSQAGGSEYPFLALLIPGANKTDPVWGLVS